MRISPRTCSAQWQIFCNCKAEKTRPQLTKGMAKPLKKYNTKQRSHIVGIFNSSPDKCFSARDVIAATEGVGQATVYRTLSLLTEEGVLNRYRGNGEDMFRLACSGEGGCHIHMVCKTCGSMIHSDCHFIGEISRHLMSEHSFALDTASTVIYGVCGGCSAKEET